MLIIFVILGVFSSCGDSNETEGSEGLEYALNIDGDGYYVKGIGICTETKIIIPSEYEGLPVTEIGYGAFMDCDLLESISIPSSIISISDYAFKGCFSLENVTLPYSLTSIGAYAFADCTAVESITIPYSVTSVGAWAFDNCISLAEVYYTGDINSWVEMKFYPYNSNPMCYATNLYFEGELVTSVEFPDYVMGIGAHLFEGCEYLTSVTIPNSVTSIGELAFLNCYSLTSITIPSSVTNIGQLAFSGCSSITSITFEGTMREWSVIEKGVYWNQSIPATEVVCSDGTVTIK